MKCENFNRWLLYAAHGHEQEVAEILGYVKTRYPHDMILHNGAEFTVEHALAISKVINLPARIIMQEYVDAKLELLGDTFRLSSYFDKKAIMQPAVSGGKNTTQPHGLFERVTRFFRRK